MQYFNNHNSMSQVIRPSIWNETSNENIDKSSHNVEEIYTDQVKDEILRTISIGFEQNDRQRTERIVSDLLNCI